MILVKSKAFPNKKGLLKETHFLGRSTILWIPPPLPQFQSWASRLQIRENGGKFVKA